MTLDPNAIPTDGSVPAQGAPGQSSSLPPSPTNPTGAMPNTPASVPPPVATPAATPAAMPATVPQAGPIAAAGSSVGNKPSLARRILQDATGGKTTDFQQTPNGPTPYKRDLTGGELARRILASVGSVFSAGIGGLEAEKQGRPFQLAAGTSLGEIQNAPVEERQKQAQQQFANTQTADEQTLRHHRDAMEQQESMRAQGDYDMRKSAWEQAHANDALKTTAEGKEIQDRMDEIDVKNQKNYLSFLSMPGAEVMKDDNGKELNFADSDEEKAYAVKNPAILHGKTNDNTKYGVVTVRNPRTNSIQLIDFPIERHDVGVEHFGQAIGTDGKPVFDKNGDPVPNDRPFGPDGMPIKGGYFLDSKGKPAVATESITANQARDLASKAITQADVEAQIKNRRAQADQRESQAKQNGDLTDAMSMFNNGDISKMNDRQKKIAQNYLGVEVRNTQYDLRNAQTEYDKISANYGDPNRTKNLKQAQADVKEAKEAHDDANERYNELSGYTPGVRLGNAIIARGTDAMPAVAAVPETKDKPGVAALPAVPAGSRNWNDVMRQINSAPISQEEKNVAISKAWRSIPAAQQAVANAAANPTGVTNMRAPDGSTRKVPNTQVPSAIANGLTAAQ